MNGIEYTKHYVNGMLVRATATVFRHNPDNRHELSEALGIPVTRDNFPQGSQVVIDYHTEPPTVRPRWS